MTKIKEIEIGLRGIRVNLTGATNPKKEKRGNSLEDLIRVGQWMIDVGQKDSAKPYQLIGFVDGGFIEWEAVQVKVDRKKCVIKIPSESYHILFDHENVYYFKKIKEEKWEEESDDSKAIVAS